jgi:tetratricopeptide (TPR) repeat protein
LVRLARACLDPRPEGRPADAGAAAAAVTAYRRSVEQRLRAAELAQVEERARALRARQRMRWATALAAAGLLIVGLLAAGWWLWQSRQAEIDRQAAATAAAAEADLDTATKAMQAEQDAVAREALERAEGRLAGGGPDELRQRLRRLRDDLDFVAELEAARMKELETTKADVYLDWAGADAAYGKAFAARGLDVTGPGAADAREWIGRSSVKGRILTALDARADVKRRAGLDGWEGLLEAAGRADDSGDEARRQLREAASRHDTGRLKELAGEPGAAAWPAADAVLLADALRAAGERAAAERVLRAAQGRNPGDFWLNEHLGDLLGHASAASREEGVGFWRAAVAARPHAAAAHNDLGALLADQGKPAEAEKEYREALRLQPDQPATHYNLGALLDEQGRAAEAEKEYRESLRLKPGFPVAHTNLGALLADQGKPAEAEKEYREALRLQPALPEAHCCLGVLLAGQGRPADAEKEYREALRINPAVPEAHYDLGNLLAGWNRPAEAEKEYREAIRLKPDYPLAHTNLGALLDAQGKAAEAEKEYREAIRLRPDYPTAHYNLGNLLHRQGKAAEAEREYREAIRLKPPYLDAHANLGLLLAGQGRAAEAEREYREALRIKPDLAETHSNLGLLLRDQGRFREALVELRRGHELGTRNPRWNLPSAAWVQDCQRLAEWDALLPAVLGGAAAPADADAALGFSHVCYYTKRYAAAVRFAAVGFSVEPARADDLQTGARYDAACSAALAGCGQGIDAPSEDAGRARLRAQALAWLRADLDARSKQAASWFPAVREEAVQALRHWREDADLAGVRDAGALEKLPEAERAAWRKLWADVDALLQKAAPPR